MEGLLRDQRLIDGVHKFRRENSAWRPRTLRPVIPRGTEPAHVVHYLLRLARAGRVGDAEPARSVCSWSKMSVTSCRRPPPPEHQNDRRRHRVCRSHSGRGRHRRVRSHPMRRDDRSVGRLAVRSGDASYSGMVGVAAPVRNIVRRDYGHFGRGGARHGPAAAENILLALENLDGYPAVAERLNAVQP